MGGGALGEESKGTSLRQDSLALDAAEKLWRRQIGQNAGAALSESGLDAPSTAGTTVSCTWSTRQLTQVSSPILHPKRRSPFSIFFLLNLHFPLFESAIDTCVFVRKHCGCSHATTIRPPCRRNARVSAPRSSPRARALCGSGSVLADGRFVINRPQSARRRRASCRPRCFGCRSCTWRGRIWPLPCCQCHPSCLSAPLVRLGRVRKRTSFPPARGCAQLRAFARRALPSEPMPLQNFALALVPRCLLLFRAVPPPFANSFSEQVSR
jgi:hypothetical protein